ncbi:MAG: NAD(P)-dependent oxidoreductase [Lachnospiraceae bacterium]|nr:NAD(P)-dependent oxidoreductase [Lachnospiraceae bacterium]
MYKVVIIGANGYIARNVIKYISDNHPNWVVKMYGRSKQQVDGYKNYASINLLDKDDIQKIDLDCDIIYYFVGKTGSANGFDEFDEFINANERSLLFLLNEYRRQKSVAKIIFPSTRLVYKGCEGAREEESENDFKTIYAINKYACEKYLEMYNNAFGINYCTLRICIPYGTLVEGATSYGTADFMMSRAQKGLNICLYGEGNVRRTLTHIEDLCRALIVCGVNSKCLNQTYNVGGEDYSLQEMALCISKKFGVSVENIEYPPLAKAIESGDTVFCDQKLVEDTNFKYLHTFKEWCE